MSLEDTVIKNIKKYRKLRNLSQEALAEKCNTATSYIGLMEIGRNVPKLSTIERIAKALDVEPYLLFIDETQALNDEKKKLIISEIQKVIDAYL